MTDIDHKERNKLVLMSFVNFCAENPQLRFWQALCVWSGSGFILSVPPEAVKNYWEMVSIKNHNTFHREGRDA